MMKKLLTLMAIAAATLAFAPIEAAAGDSFRSRIHSRCSHCGHNILSYYRPVRTVATRSIYGWVPSYHSNCGKKLHGSLYGQRQVYGGSNLRFRYGSANHHNYGYSSGVVRRSVPAVGLQRRTISTYPGWRFSSLNRCR